MALTWFDAETVRSVGSLRLAAAVFALAPAVAPSATVAQTPAAVAQTPCSDSGWAEHNVIAYHFAWLSRQRGDNLVNCVRNRHRDRAVFVDWQVAGLRGFVPPGGTIYDSSPLAGRRPSRRSSRFFFGARPNVLTVPTLSRVGPRRPATTLAPSMLHRAAFWQVGSDSPLTSSSSLVYVPVSAGSYGMEVNRPSLRAVVDWLENHPDRLRPLTMTFENRVVREGDGRLSVSWSCAYRIDGLPATGGNILHLRFTDPDLQTRMFGEAEPFPLENWRGETEGENTFRAGLPPLPVREVVPRTARLEVLLDDARTVIASIPVSFLSTNLPES